MLHRIRLAMQNGTFSKFGGPGNEVEADEAFIGGKVKNMHPDRRAAFRKARASTIGNVGHFRKTAVWVS